MRLARKILQWILILSGLFLMVAFVAVLLPVDWMNRAHQWLGLGEFPNRPVTLYLARSTSLLYGVHGVLMFYTGLTLDRHWRLVWLFGWLHILIGITVFFIDLTAPMPLYWVLAEGLPVAGLGVFLLVLAKMAYGTAAPSIQEENET